MAWSGGRRCRSRTSSRQSLHRLGHERRRRRPFDRDRIPLHRGQLAAVRDGERLPVDPRFEQAVDGIDEVVAVELGVKAEDAAAQQPVEQLLPPGADAERFGVRPGDVPEGDDRGRRQLLLDHPRQQGEVIVLDQDDRVGGRRLPAPRRGRTCRLTLDVLLPVRGAERRADVGDVAERPETFVREAVVVAGLLLRA